jgi:hypothetical protein
MSSSNNRPGGGVTANASFIGPSGFSFQTAAPPAAAPAPAAGFGSSGVSPSGTMFGNSGAPAGFSFRPQNGGAPNGGATSSSDGSSSGGVFHFSTVNTLVEDEDDAVPCTIQEHHFIFDVTSLTGGRLAIEEVDEPLKQGNDACYKVFEDKIWDLGHFENTLKEIAKDNPGSEAHRKKLCVAFHREAESVPMQHADIYQGNGALRTILDNMTEQERLDFVRQYGIRCERGAKTFIPFGQVAAIPGDAQLPSTVCFSSPCGDKTVSFDELRQKYPMLKLKWMKLDVDLAKYHCEAYILVGRNKIDGSNGCVSKEEFMSGHLLFPSYKKEHAKLGNPLETFLDTTFVVGVEGCVWADLVDDMNKNAALGPKVVDRFSRWAEHKERTPEEFTDLVVPSLMDKLLRYYQNEFLGGTARPIEAFENVGIDEAIIRLLLYFPFVREESDRDEITSALSTKVSEAYRAFAEASGITFEIGSLGSKEIVDASKYTVEHIRYAFASSFLSAVTKRLETITLSENRPVGMEDLEDILREEDSNSFELADPFEIDSLLACAILVQQEAKAKLQDELTEKVSEKFKKWKVNRNESDVLFGYRSTEVKFFKLYAKNDFFKNEYLTEYAVTTSFGPSKLNSLGNLSTCARAELSNVFPKPRRIEDRKNLPLFEQHNGEIDRFARTITVKNRDNPLTAVTLTGQEVETYGKKGLLALCAAALKLHTFKVLLNKLINFREIVGAHVQQETFYHVVCSFVGHQAKTVAIAKSLGSSCGVSTLPSLDGIQEAMDGIVDILLGCFRELAGDQDLDAVAFATLIEDSNPSNAEAKERLLKQVGRQCLTQVPASDQISMYLDSISKNAKLALESIGEGNLFQTPGEISVSVGDQFISFSSFKDLDLLALVPKETGGKLVVTFAIQLHSGDHENPAANSECAGSRQATPIDESHVDKEVLWAKFGVSHSRKRGKAMLLTPPDLSGGSLTYAKGKALLEARKKIRQTYFSILTGQEGIKRHHIGRFLRSPPLQMAVTPGGIVGIRPYSKNGHLHWDIWFYRNIECDHETKTAVCTIMKESMTDNQLKIVLRDRSYSLVHECLCDHKELNGKDFSGAFAVESPDNFRAFEVAQMIDSIRPRPDGGFEVLIDGQQTLGFDKHDELQQFFEVNGFPYTQNYEVKLNEMFSNKDTNWICLPPGASSGNKNYEFYVDEKQMRSPIMYMAQVRNLDCLKQTVLEMVSREPRLMSKLDTLETILDSLFQHGDKFARSFTHTFKCEVEKVFKDEGLFIKSTKDYDVFNPTENAIFVYAMVQKHTVGLKGNMLLDTSEKYALSISQHNLDLLNRGRKFQGFDHCYVATLKTPAKAKQKLTRWQKRKKKMQENK